MSLADDPLFVELADQAVGEMLDRFFGWDRALRKGGNHPVWPGEEDYGRGNLLSYLAIDRAARTYAALRELPYSSAIVSGLASLVIPAFDFHRGAKTPRTPDHSARIGCTVLYPAYRHAECSRPVWHLSEACVRALWESDLPSKLDPGDIAKFRLPFPGLMLEFPEGCKIPHAPVSNHEGWLTGIMICEGYTFASLDSNPEPAGGGFHYYNANPQTPEGLCRFRDDHRRVVTVVERLRTPDEPCLWIARDIDYTCVDGFSPRVVSAVRIAVNLLFALHAGYLDVRELRESRQAARIRRGGGRAKRQTRTEVHLGPRPIFTPPEPSTVESEVGHAAPEPQPARGSMPEHLVRGHWHGYWVRNPGENKVIMEKQGARGPLYLIAKWIEPYIQGSGPFKAPEYQTTKPPTAPKE